MFLFLSALDSTESGIALVEDLEFIVSYMHDRKPWREKRTYGVDALEEGVAQDIKSQVSPALDTAVSHSIARVRKGQIRLVDVELLVADCKAHDWQLVGRGVGREEVTLLLAIELATWDGVVDFFTYGVIHKRERGACIGDGGVARASDGLASDGRGGGCELPEPLRVIDRCIVRCLTTQGVLVDVAEGVE